MLADLSFRIDVSSVQRAAHLRDEISEFLSGQDETTVIGTQANKVTQDYTVLGVDITTKEPFTEAVEAVSPEEAEATVATATKVVVLARQRTS